MAHHALTQSVRELGSLLCVCSQGREPGFRSSSCQPRLLSPATPTPISPFSTPRPQQVFLKPSLIRSLSSRTPYSPQDNGQANERILVIYRFSPPSWPHFLLVCALIIETLPHFLNSISPALLVSMILRIHLPPANLAILERCPASGLCLTVPRLFPPSTVR